MAQEFLIAPRVPIQHASRCGQVSVAVADKDVNAVVTDFLHSVRNHVLRVPRGCERPGGCKRRGCPPSFCRSHRVINANVVHSARGGGVNFHRPGVYPSTPSVETS
jgi:hypothetical protein